MEVLQSFGSWDQKIDLWFTYDKPLIPTLYILEIKQVKLQWTPTFKSESCRIVNQSNQKINTSVFDHTHPKIIEVTFSFLYFVSVCKTPVYTIYQYVKHQFMQSIYYWDTCWLVESNLAHISGTRFFWNMRFVQ